SRDQTGRILQVSVEGDDGIAHGRIKAGGKSGFLTEVPRELNRTKAWITLDECNQFRQGVIATAIINTNDFEAEIRHLVQRAAHRVEKGSYCLSLVVEGHDDGYELGLNSNGAQ